jgi:iron complex outermembrane receptor protein
MLSLPQAAFSANAPETNPSQDAESSDELMLFEDMPEVVSASRQATPINWLSAPVSIVTDEDIHYSGATNIPEILQFVPGVDVLRQNRNQYMAGVHGLESAYSDRTLVLLDGQEINDPVFIGTEWTRIPVMMEDIERIEVVRGPGGAAWGANAYNGVVNIITKDPEKQRGALLSTTDSFFGDMYHQGRYASRWGAWVNRASFAYRGVQSSDRAIHGNDFVSYDSGQDSMFSDKAVYRWSDETSLTLGGTYENSLYGEYPMAKNSNINTLIISPTKSRLQRTTYSARLDRQVDRDTSGYLQYFGEYSENTSLVMPRYGWLDNKIEGQYNFRPVSSHSISVGGNFLWSNVWSAENISQQLANSPINEYQAGLFLIDRWQMSDRLVLETQARGDWYSPVQTDWSLRTSAMYAVDAEKNHILRLSGAKAFRAPMAGTREIVSHQGLVFPPSTYAFTFNPNPDLVNEEAYSVEAGYTGRLTKHLTLRDNLYYQRCDRLIGTVINTNPFTHFVTMKYMNLSGADAYGNEVELALEGKPGKLSAWYALNLLVPDNGQGNFRGYYPAQNKTGLTGRLNLPQDWTLNTNYLFTSTSEADQYIGQNVSPQHRWDIAVTKKITANIEATFGVNDILNTTDPPVYQAVMLAHDTPGRTFFARLQARF